MSDGLLLVTASLEIEIRPFVRRFGLRPDSRRSYVGSARGRRLAALLVGVGGSRAEEQLAAFLDAFAPARVVLAGFAGGLVPALRVADCVRPQEIVCERSGETLAPTFTRPPQPSGLGGRVERVRSPAARGPSFDGTSRGRLVTVAELATRPAQRAAIAERFRAEAADMETANLARLCSARGVPWSSVRAISDDHTTTLPEGIEALTDPDGRASAAAALRFAASNPRSLPALIRLGVDANRAAAALASELEGFVVDD